MEQIKQDERAYLEFQVLVDIKQLERIDPNHYLVAAVRKACDEQVTCDPRQESFDFHSSRNSEIPAP